MIEHRKSHRKSDIGMNAGQRDKIKRKLQQLLIDDTLVEDDLHVPAVDSKLEAKHNHNTRAKNPNNKANNNNSNRVGAVSAENKENKRNKTNIKRNKLSKRKGQIVKKETIYDTWYVIKPHELPTEPTQQRYHLQLPLVKLANATTYMKLPSVHWTSKVTLFKVRPTILQRHTLTIFTGDLMVHKIPEKDRNKYQPSCVIFRRNAVASQLPVVKRKCYVPFDRVVIFKNKYFNVNIDGEHVNLNGAPEAVTCIQDIQKLLDILDCITISNPMIEIVPSK